MAQFIYFIRPAREAFPATATAGELAVVSEHFEYLKQALAAGRLILAGRTQNAPPNGIVIFEAADDAEARAFMEADPAVRAGVFMAELQPFGVALERTALTRSSSAQADEVVSPPGPTHSEDGVDLTLIRWMLSMTPAERLETLQQSIRSIARLRGDRRSDHTLPRPTITSS